MCISMYQVSSNIYSHIGILFMSERLLSVLVEIDENKRKVNRMAFPFIFHTA